MKRCKIGKNCKISKQLVHIDSSVVIGNNVRIYDNVTILGKTIIKNNVIIFSNCEISNCIIGESSSIKNSIIDGAEIGSRVNIGPFARIRPKTTIGDDVLIGNFVEVKNSVIGNKTKACHLAYIGDSTIGKNVNVGCGAIFVNYNGKIKQKSIVEDNAFIGSNCNIIAPVKIGRGAYICAGTTITKDVNSDDFVIGRVRQEHKQDLAKKFLTEDLREEENQLPEFLNNDNMDQYRIR